MTWHDMAWKPRPTRRVLAAQQGSSVPTAGGLLQDAVKKLEVRGTPRCMLRNVINTKGHPMPPRQLDLCQVIWGHRFRDRIGSRDHTIQLPVEG